MPDKTIASKLKALHQRAHALRHGDGRGAPLSQERVDDALDEILAEIDSLSENLLEKAESRAGEAPALPQPIRFLDIVNRHSQMRPMLEEFGETLR